MDNKKQNKEINSIKLGKLQIYSQSTLLTIVLSIIFLIGFCTFCFSSCTKDIVVQYIKSNNNNNIKIINKSK